MVKRLFIVIAIGLIALCGIPAVGRLLVVDASKGSYFICLLSGGFFLFAISMALFILYSIIRVIVFYIRDGDFDIFS